MLIGPNLALLKQSSDPKKRINRIVEFSKPWLLSFGGAWDADVLPGYVEGSLSGIVFQPF
jgi:hypothetical protein